MIKAIELKEIIDNISNINFVIPNLNHGGCGVFAQALAEKLMSKGVHCEIAIIGEMGTGNEEIINNSIYNVYNKCKEKHYDFNARALHNSGMTIYHVMTKVKTYEGTFYADSEGIYTHPANSRWNVEIEGICDIETFKPLIESTVGWNKMYSREMDSRVYKMIDSAVNRVIKETAIYNESKRVYATI